MTYIKIGKYTTTHGLKGEIKIISNIRDNDLIYKIGNTIYIGKDKKPFIINSYRKHKHYDMITLNNLNSLEEVLPYKGNDIYIKEEDTTTNMIDMFINYDVYNNDIYIGKIIDLITSFKYDYIVISDKRIIVPFIDEFIINIDKDNKTIKMKYPFN